MRYHGEVQNGNADEDEKELGEECGQDKQNESEELGERDVVHEKRNSDECGGKHGDEYDKEDVDEDNIEHRHEKLVERDVVQWYLNGYEAEELDERDVLERNSNGEDYDE